MGQHLDSFLLKKVRDYLLTDLHQAIIQSSAEDYQQIRLSLRSLSQTSHYFRQIFPPSLFPDFLNQEVRMISFQPYQLREPHCLTCSYSHEAQPIHHNYQMATYVLRWKSCPSCLAQMINCFAKTNHCPELKITIKPNRWKELFCDEHWKDLNQERLETDDPPLSIWKSVHLKLTYNQRQPNGYQINLEVFTKPHYWKWC